MSDLSSLADQMRSLKVVMRGARDAVTNGDY